MRYLNIFRFLYKNQPVNIIYENNHCLLWVPFETHKHTLRRNKEFRSFKAGVTYKNQWALDVWDTIIYDIIFFLRIMFEIEKKVSHVARPSCTLEQYPSMLALPYEKKMQFL
jgi:hypothetical protein